MCCLVPGQVASGIALLFSVQAALLPPSSALALLQLAEKIGSSQLARPWSKYTAGQLQALCAREPMTADWPAMRIT